MAACCSGAGPKDREAGKALDDDDVIDDDDDDVMALRKPEGHWGDAPPAALLRL